MKPLLILLLCISVSAYASDKKDRPPKNVTVKNYEIDDSVTNNLDANAEAGAVAEASSEAGAEASNGDMTSITQNAFMAYGQSDRPATGCFASGDAAGANDGKFGALGFYWLDNNCWADYLASEEDNIYLNARLKCDSKRYRRAIAHDIPAGLFGWSGRNRRAVCIDRVESVSMARLNMQREEVQQMIDESKAEVLGVVDKVESDLKERDARIHEAGRIKK